MIKYSHQENKDFHSWPLSNLREFLKKNHMEVKEMGWIILIIVAVWFVLSVKILGPEEMAVLVFLGKPVGFRDSGIHLVLFLFFRLEKRPKKLFNLDYPAREVITKEKRVRGTKYGTQILKVDAVAYLSFPREAKARGDLIKIVQFDVPFDEEKLKTWTEDSVVGVLRAVFAGMSWKEAIEKIEEIRKEVEDKFREADGALVKAGFNPDDLKLTITEIKLPPELAKTLPLPDQERIKKDAAKFVAERQAREWVGMVLESYALVQGKSLKEIQAEIEADKKLQRELLDYAEEMNQRLEEANRGAFHHVIVGGNGKPNKEKGEGFIDALVKGVIEVIIASKMFPGGKGGEEKTPSEKKEKKLEEMDGEEKLRHLEREEFGKERS